MKESFEPFFQEPFLHLSHLVFVNRLAIYDLNFLPNFLRKKKEKTTIREDEAKVWQGERFYVDL